MLPDAVAKARALFDDLTPLRADCGLYCGGACCQSMEGEPTGMLLFPGEDVCYEGHAGYVMVQAEHGRLLICSGRCSRDERPLSCRLFPLIPLLREEGVKVATDQRAKAVCPLAKRGKETLLPEFVSAVRQAGRILAADETQRAFLLRLTQEQDDLKALRNQFGRKPHV